MHIKLPTYLSIDLSNYLVTYLLGLAPIGTKTITLDLIFASLTLLELVLH
jgi:hypothetical protein